MKWYENIDLALDLLNKQTTCGTQQETLPSAIIDLTQQEHPYKKLRLSSNSGKLLSKSAMASKDGAATSLLGASSAAASLTEDI